MSRRSPRRERLAWIVLLGLLAVAAGWSVRSMQQQRSGMETAAEALHEAGHYADRIARLEHQPQRAGARRMPVNQLTQMIEQCVEAAGIEPGRLDRVWPEPPRRLGDSPYQESVTRILLRRVTLEQLIELLRAIDRAEQRLTVSMLRLTAPRGVDDLEQPGPGYWTVELNISYLIYAPRGDDRAGAGRARAGADAPDEVQRES